MNQVVYLGADFGIDAAKDELKDSADIIHIKDENELEDAIGKAHAILDASMKFKITDQLVRKAPNLKVISCATTGSDHIDRKELDNRGIPLHTLKEDPDLLKNMTPAAELSWALLLACARRLKGAFQHVADGAWVREEFPGKMLNGSTLGLIGCGRIGGWMARYAKAFGMRVLAYDPYQDTFPDDVEESDLETLAAESDFISIHVHLNEETENLVSSKIVKKFKSGAVFINTSRGAIVDEKALLEALQNNQIAAAGLDVLSGEPDINDHPLVEYARNHNNLLITPHCGGFSPDAVRIVCRRAAEKISSVLNQKKID